MQQTFASLSAITVKFVLGALLFVFLSGMLLSYVLFAPVYRERGGQYAPDDERPAPCQQPRPVKKQNPCHGCGQK